MNKETPFGLPEAKVLYLNSASDGNLTVITESIIELFFVLSWFDLKSVSL